MKQDVLDNYTGEDSTKEEILDLVKDKDEYVSRTAEDYSK